MNSTVSIAPQITQFYDSNLLNRPLPGEWNDPKEVREKYYGFLKYSFGSRGWKEINELLEIYEELYEWQLSQKAYNEAKKKEILERPALPIEAIHRLKGELGKNVRSVFSCAFPGCLKNYAIQKVQRRK